MESVKHIVKQVVERCAAQGVECSEPLAAFAARTIVYDNESRFQVHKEMTNEDLNELIQLTTERLLQRDSPSLETIKMQVAFDISSAENKRVLADEKKGHQDRIAELQRNIVRVKVPSGGGFEKFTTLYRQVFSYLVLSTVSALSDRKGRQGEREVAAALESVFPRVSLKSFMTMRNEDKRKQLSELTNIVLGIRLFNRALGKGGQDMVDLSQETGDLIANLVDEMNATLNDCKRNSQNYTDVLLHAHREPAAKVTAAQVDRWQRELTNRRQLCFYTEDLLKSVRKANRNVDAAIGVLERELVTLKSIIGSRNSVPKEMVYPKFDILARNWLQLADEFRVLKSLKRTWDVVLHFKTSFAPTLSSRILAEAHKAAGEQAQAGLGRNASFYGGGGGFVSSSSAGGSVDGTADDGRDLGAAAEGKAASGAVLVTQENTPEIMNLPLEYKGFCPVTLVERKGLLLPGDVAIGLVRFQNRFFAFATKSALNRFIQRPADFIDAVNDMARKSSELISMLGLHAAFPDVSFSQLTGDVRPADVHPLLAPPAPLKRDACTETPLHFVEKHIDHNYTWNEWTLRKEALRLANIRKAKTSSTQTVASHFRQHQVTQVYLKRTKDTQTGISRGTNPIQFHNYIVGLRGFEGNRTKLGVVHSKYVKPGPNVLKASGASVVNLSFDTT